MDTSFYLSCAGELGGLNWHNKKKKRNKAITVHRWLPIYKENLWEPSNKTNTSLSGGKMNSQTSICLYCVLRK